MFSEKTVILKTLSIVASKHFSITNKEFKEKMIFVPKKLSFLALPYSEGPLLQTRTTLFLKDTLNYFKLQILFKSQN